MNINSKIDVSGGRPKENSLEGLTTEEEVAYRQFAEITLPWIKDYYKDENRYIADNIISYEELKNNLIRKIEGVLERKEKAVILNIGAGKQALEKEIIEYFKKIGSENRVMLVPMDILDKKYLNSELLPNSVTADAIALPFKKESFDIIVSEMAIGALPMKALREVYNALKKGGAVLFHFDWWEAREKVPLEIVGYLEKYSIGGIDNNLKEIERKFKEVGFVHVEADIEGQMMYGVSLHWIRVEAIKS